MQCVLRLDVFVHFPCLRGCEVQGQGSANIDYAERAASNCAKALMSFA